MAGGATFARPVAASRGRCLDALARRLIESARADAPERGRVRGQAGGRHPDPGRRQRGGAVREPRRGAGTDGLRPDDRQGGVPAARAVPASDPRGESLRRELRALAVRTPLRTTGSSRHSDFPATRRRWAQDGSVAPTWKRPRCRPPPKRAPGPSPAPSPAAGKPNALSDVGTAAALAVAGLRGALMNRDQPRALRRRSGVRHRARRRRSRRRPAPAEQRLPAGSSGTPTAGRAILFQIETVTDVRVLRGAISRLHHK